jgi:hypothetical protein
MVRELCRCAEKWGECVEYRLRRSNVILEAVREGIEICSGSCAVNADSQLDPNVEGVRKREPQVLLRGYFGLLFHSSNSFNPLNKGEWLRWSFSDFAAMSKLQRIVFFLTILMILLPSPAALRYVSCFGRIRLWRWIYLIDLAAVLNRLTMLPNL